LRQRLRLVVAGGVRAAIEDPGVPFGDGAVKCHEFGVEIAVRLLLCREMVMAILAAHEEALSSLASSATSVGI
jgi:hypothetical protein